MTLAIESAARAEGRRPRFSGIGSDAAALGVTRGHLWAVLTGRRESRPLLSRYQALKQQPVSAERHMNSPAVAPLPAAPAPFPVDFAALQNLIPEFVESVQKGGNEIVVVVLESLPEPNHLVTLKDPPPPRTLPDPIKTPADLGQALRAEKAGMFDASLLRIRFHFHFFHVPRAKLGVAIGILKSALDEKGFLPIASIIHLESHSQLMHWIGEEAGKAIDLEADTDT